MTDAAKNSIAAKSSVDFSALAKSAPIDIEQIDMLVSDVSSALEAEFDNEVPTKAIGERIMNKLKNIDKIAFVRFASVYKDFRDIDELAREISDLKEQG